jgi:hypothetical protein
MRRRKPPETPAASYEIGYGKPPAATRFQKGKSGNPNGRPAKSPTSKSLDPSLTGEVLEVAKQLMTVREGDTHRQISTLAVIFKSIVKSAASGNSRAQRHFIEIFAQAKAEENARIDEQHRLWSRYIEIKRAEIASFERRGIAPPRIVPHPDDILIRDGQEVVFCGPCTDEEADNLDRLARLNEASLLHFVWECGVLPHNPETDRKMLSVTGVLFYQINPILPDRMRLSSEEITRRTQSLICASRARERAIVLEAWSRAFPGHSIKLKPILISAEVSGRLGLGKSALDQLAEHFDFSTMS